MPLALLILATILAFAYLPQWWIGRVLRRHGAERADMPGSGAEIARRLLDGEGLRHVRVERSKEGDHYDPDAKTVRLSKDHFDRRSLAAAVVAAHEVGHAIQDATGYAPLARRTVLARQAGRIERVGSIVMLAAPVMLLLAKSPLALLADYAAGAVILGAGVMMHASTLPVEYDASFRRALPLLRRTALLRQSDLPAAREILRAAALTYVASALMTLLNVARWFRVFRF